MRKIKAFYPNFFSDELIAYVALRILSHFNTSDIKATIMGICSDKTVKTFKKANVNACNRRIYYDAIPSLIIWKILTFILPETVIQRFAERRFARTVRSGDIVYLWPDSSRDLYKKIKQKGCILLSERINTMRMNSKKILDAEYARIGIEPQHRISKESVTAEIEKMKLVDYVFSPSPSVRNSLVDAGISHDKILDTSYGLKSEEIFETIHQKPESAIPTAIFVGSICIRKGVHLLLNTWSRLKSQANLRIVGRVSPEIKPLLDEHLSANTNICHIDFVEDLMPIYKDADFFILPSLEEGSPLVTYLALGAGLPVIASPQGAGGVIENEKEGIVVNPHNEKEFTNAIEKVIKNSKFRMKMAAAAHRRAYNYSWERVACRRLELLEKKGVLPPIKNL